MPSLVPLTDTMDDDSSTVQARAWRILRSLDDLRARITDFNAHEALESIKVLCQSHSDEYVVSYMRAALEQMQMAPEDLWPSSFSIQTLFSDHESDTDFSSTNGDEEEESTVSHEDITESSVTSSTTGEIAEEQEIFIPPSFPPTPAPPSPSSDQSWTQWSTPVLPASQCWPSPYPPHSPYLPHFLLSPHQLNVRLHPHISYNMQNPMIPHFNWDILHPPEHGSFTNFHLPRKPNFTEASVSPPSSKIEIVTDHPVLMYWMSTIWGPIVVENPAGTSLSLGEVLNAIHKYFRQPLTSRDRDLLCATPGNRERVEISHQQRARNSFELEAFVLKDPLRRIDVLGSHRQFQGLRSVVFPDASWKLFMGLLPSDRRVLHPM